MYPLHLNYTTTLPCKTITIKITIFHRGIFLVTPEFLYRMANELIGP